MASLNWKQAAEWVFKMVGACGIVMSFGMIVLVYLEQLFTGTRSTILLTNTIGEYPFELAAIFVGIAYFPFMIVVVFEDILEQPGLE